jgi:hypothetical protein
METTMKAIRVTVRFPLSVAAKTEEEREHLFEWAKDEAARTGEIRRDELYVIRQALRTDHHLYEGIDIGSHLVTLWIHPHDEGNLTDSVRFRGIKGDL